MEITGAGRARYLLPIDFLNGRCENIGAIIRCHGPANMDKNERFSSRNRLLAYLTRVDYLRLNEHLEEVSLAYRASLYRANVPIDYVYFLEEGVASLVNTMRKGTSVEVGTAGNEGMVGLPIVFGDQQSAGRGSFTRCCSASFVLCSKSGSAIRAMLRS